MNMFAMEARISSLVVETPSLKKKTLAAMAAANERAQRRFDIARIVGETHGTLAEKEKALMDAVLERRLAPSRLPCLGTIWKLARRWQDGARSVADYRDDETPRGPKARAFPVGFVDHVVTLAQQHGTADLPHLVRLANRHGERIGVEPISVWHLRRILAPRRTEIIAGRHGSRAAIMDACVRSTYPTSRTHELWFLDEGDPKYWSQGFCPRRYWISVRPMVILIRDHRTGAFPGFWVADPSRRIDAETGLCLENGFDADDVLSALLSAASKDLASPGLEDIAGALCETMQWDNAPSHKFLESTLFERTGGIRRVSGFHDPDEIEELAADEHTPELNTKRIPVRRPDRNGTIEKLMGYVKKRLVGIPGHVSECIPADRLVDGEDLGRARAMGATSPSGRLTRLTPVSVRTLPTIERLRTAVGEVLAAYNAKNVLRRNGLTPVVAAKKFMPPRYRLGDDMIRMLPVARYKVNGGVEVQRDGRSVMFYPIDNGIVLQRGSSVRAYVHPLLECIWLEHGKRLVCLKPTPEVASEQAPGDVAGTMSGVARAASDAAVVNRATWLDAQVGAGAAAEGEEIYDQIRKNPRRPKEDSSRRSARPVGPAPSASVPSPFSSAGPAANDDDSYDFDPNALVSQLPPHRDDV